MEDKGTKRFSVSGKLGFQEDQVKDLFETEQVNKYVWISYTAFIQEGLVSKYGVEPK